jgi:hypothetical protein
MTASRDTVVSCGAAAATRPEASTNEWASALHLYLGVESCYICPKCQSTDVHMTLPSHAGAYCQCRTCGNLWHDDKKPPGSPGPAQLKRKTDARS